MRAALVIIIVLAVLFVARHAGDKPQLAVDATPAKATKAQAPVCTAPWEGPLKKPRSIA